LRKLKSQTPKHPVKVGEYVKRLTGFNTTPAGEIGRVTRVDDDAAEIEYEVKRPNGETGVWCAKNCEPCDPPTEATHDTQEGRSVAESAVKVDPKPGDTVRLVRVPTPDPELDGLVTWPWQAEWGKVGEVAEILKTLNASGLPAIAVRLASGLVVWWPLSCVEVVKGGDK
jgi:hypothetical protein